MTIIGIDCGFTGALAAFDTDLRFLQVEDMPTVKSRSGRTELNHHAVLEFLGRYDGEVWLEEVHSHPGQGVTSMFRFGQGYGAIEMACAAIQMPLRYVAPARWKRHFGLIGKPKDSARSVALQRFPTASALFARKRDVGRADASLVALYGSEARV